MWILYTYEISYLYEFTVKFHYIYVYVKICTYNFMIELTLKDSCHKKLWTKSGMLRIYFYFEVLYTHVKTTG